MTAQSVAVCTWGATEGSGETEEVLAVARHAGDSLDAELHWLVLGSATNSTVEAVAARYGVDAVDRMEDTRLETFQPDVYVEALARYCAGHPHNMLLFSQTYDVRLVAPRLAGRLGSAVVMNGLEIAFEGATPRVTASAYGGDTRVVYEVRGDEPHIIACMPNAAAPEPREGPVPPIHDVRVDLELEERIRVVERTPEKGPRLEEARIIVAGGRGLGAPDKFALVEELAQALGGMAAASRPIVDDGWADPSRQIGLTGKIARPALYVAAGISGASQHMAGCSAAKTIVAINSDPDAPIFRYARYGVVGDCVAILEELTRAARQP